MEFGHHNYIRKTVNLKISSSYLLMLLGKVEENPMFKCSFVEMKHVEHEHLSFCEQQLDL